MSRGYDGKTSALQALDSDRLNFVAGWISHAVECTKFLPTLIRLSMLERHPHNFQSASLNARNQNGSEPSLTLLISAVVKPIGCMLPSAHVEIFCVLGQAQNHSECP
jgi:hypothetical protein